MHDVQGAPQLKACTQARGTNCLILGSETAVKSAGSLREPHRPSFPMEGSGRRRYFFFTFHLPSHVTVPLDSVTLVPVSSSSTTRIKHLVVLNKIVSRLWAPVQAGLRGHQIMWPSLTLDGEICLSLEEVSLSII